MSDAIEIFNGGTPRSSVDGYWNGGIPWYTAKDAPSLSDVFVLETQRTISKAGIQNSATTILPAGTTIITARGTVGNIACLGRDMAMNQTCYGIRGICGYPDYFTYWFVRNSLEQLQSRTHGTIFDTITRQTFNVVEVVLPTTSVATAFENIVKPLMERILWNRHQSLTLAHLLGTYACISSNDQERSAAMADASLTQSEADVLFATEKYRIDTKEWDYPYGGGGVSVPLVSIDRREPYFLDIFRSRIDLAKGRYQNRGREVVVLARLDFGGRPHRNPDQAYIGSPHLHRFREGYGDKWAFPVPAERFADLNDAWRTLEDFMTYCNIIVRPVIRRGLLT
jgi:restriction endonuclease S subunit